MDRLAICIQHENDSSGTWTEYTNTSQLAKSWTFDRTGLYTITLRARAINSTTSALAEHVFKIRVY